jgi:hypothetical protein
MLHIQAASEGAKARHIRHIKTQVHRGEPTGEELRGGSAGGGEGAGEKERAASILRVVDASLEFRV